jgi:hypothetical protein
MMVRGIIIGWLKICFSLRRVGHQRSGIVFAARQRARDRNHANLRVAKRAEAPLGRRLKTVETILIKNLVLHAHQDDLGCIHHGAAADRNDEVGLCVFRLRCRLHHHLPRGVLRYAIERTCMPIAEVSAKLFDLIRLGVQRPARNQENPSCAETLGLLAKRLGRRLAVDDPFHRRVLVTSRGLHDQLLLNAPV